MSGFVAAYNWNVACRMGYPLVAPVDRSRSESWSSKKKYSLYCITLGLCIYRTITFPSWSASSCACTFSCSYRTCLALMAGSVPRKGCLAQSDVLLYFPWLAGGLAAVLLIPEIAALHATEFSEFNFPEKINWYFSFFDVIARHATGVSRETGLDHWPNIFCSSAVFFLIPLYIVNRKIPLKEKLGRLVLCPFHRQLLGQYPEFHLARFQLPDSLPARQSFCTSCSCC